MENEFSLSLLSQYLYHHIRQCKSCSNSFNKNINQCDFFTSFISPYYNDNTYFNCAFAEAINANVVPQSILDDITEFSISNL